MGSSNNEASRSPMLRLPRGATKEEVLASLQEEEAGKEVQPLGGLAATMLSCEIDGELAHRLLEFCSTLSSRRDEVEEVEEEGISLCVAHNDLGSGQDLEQRLFDRLAEREAVEAQKRVAEKKKKDSSSQKDFSLSAGMRRAGEEGIRVADAKLAALDEELDELNRRKKETPWYALFSNMEARSRNGVSVLDLSNCGLHCTGMTMLTRVLCELEQRGGGAKVHELVLDGNTLEDIGMTPVASLLRLSKALRVLRLRNVGVTERGMSQVLSALVGNKTIQLVDLRSNGLASAEVSKAAMDGVRRFNNFTQVLL